MVVLMEMEALIMIVYFDVGIVWDIISILNSGLA